MQSCTCCAKIAAITYNGLCVFLVQYLLSFIIVCETAKPIQRSDCVWPNSMMMFNDTRECLVAYS